MKYLLVISLIALSSMLYIKPEVRLEAKETVKWTKSTHELHKKLVKNGMENEIAKLLIDECKTYAKNPKHCVITGAFILKAESSMGTRYNSCNSIFSIMTKCYSSRSEAIKDFVKRYNKYWYKTKGPKDFYNNVKGKHPRTYFCMSERQSKIEGYCPLGYKHSTSLFNSLTK